MLQPHFWRQKTTAGRETYPHAITASCIEVQRIGFAIAIDVNILDLTWCTPSILQPQFWRQKTTAGRETYPHAITASCIEVQRIGFAIAIDVYILDLIGRRRSM